MRRDHVDPALTVRPPAALVWVVVLVVFGAGFGSMAALDLKLRRAADSARAAAYQSAYQQGYQEGYQVGFRAMPSAPVAKRPAVRVDTVPAISHGFDEAAYRRAGGAGTLHTYSTEPRVAP